MVSFKDNKTGYSTKAQVVNSNLRTAIAGKPAEA